MAASRIAGIFTEGFARGASDVHLAAGQRPFLRLDGEMTPLSEDSLTQT